MDTLVLFYDGMDIDPNDFTSMEGFIQTAVDNIVLDAITANNRYAGFTVTKTGTTTVSVATGRLYSSGQRFRVDTPIANDFLGSLPLVGNKICSVVTWGTPNVQTNVTPREFLINEETGASEPRSVATQSARQANIQFALGVEAPNPTPPVVSVGYTVIANILLTPTGVSTITMNTANQLPNLDNMTSRVAALETWEAVAAPQLISIASDISRLSNEVSSAANQSLVGQILSRLATLEAKDGIPSTSTNSLADFFLTGDSSDLTNALSNCKVSEGVRFADNGAADQSIQLANPLNPLVTMAGTTMFPAYTPSVRWAIGPQTGSVPISSYTYQSVTYKQKTMSRTRTRYGTEFTVCTNSAFWRSGSYDPISGIFTLPDGETFLAAFDPTSGVYATNSGNGLSHVGVRLEEFWTDTTNENYWDRQITTGTIAGSSVEETFSQGQDLWLAAIGIYLPQLDASGSVTLAICECNDTGEVDINSVLSQVTVPYANLTASGEVKFTFPVPVLLSAGQRYGFRVTTPANHYIATADGSAYPSGMFFAMVGGYPVADPTKHVVSNFYTCEFTQSVVSIDLEGLQLAGGIVGVDILAASLVPASTTLAYSVQIAGVWTALNAANLGNINAGGSLPPLLPFRVTMSGSTDMMPCIDLGVSNIHLSRPNTADAHVWPLNGVTLQSSSTAIRATVRYESWSSSHHTASCTLLTGASFTTQTAASSFSDVVNDDGSIERTYVWNLGAAITAYKLYSQGTTDSALDVFHIAWIKTWAQ